VRWLRPDYQIPRFGAPAEKAELDLVGGEARAATAPAGKPLFPADDHGQTAAVVLVLAGAEEPMDAATIAARFRQGRRIAPKVAAVLAAIARSGLALTTDGGARFLLRRAA
jgi:hypothetical protein